MRTHGRLPAPLLALAAALLGAGAVVLPAIAASETAPAISAESNPGSCGAYSNCWSPAQVSVEAAGGRVQFKNESGVDHGLVWESGPSTPSCEGVPVNSFSTSFSGSCKFAQPGTYVFYCAYHGRSMSGTVTVNGSGTTTVTTNNTNPTQTYTSGNLPTSYAGQGGYAAPGSGSETSGNAPQGGAIVAAKVASSQRGRSVRGSITISPAAAGGRLEVDLLAGQAALAGAGHPAQLRVGKLLRSGLHAGVLSFSVPLSARARAALHRRGRLTLQMRIIVAPASGTASAVSRRVTVRP